MSNLLNDLGKTVSEGVNRVRFEARKFERTTRLQSETYELRSRLDSIVAQLGRRTLELLRQGTLSHPELASFMTQLQQIEHDLAAKEQELRTAQAEVYVEPQASAPAQQVPIESEPASASATRACPRCGHIGTPTSLFCSNCGARMTVA